MEGEEGVNASPNTIFKKRTTLKRCLGHFLTSSISKNINIYCRRVCCSLFLDIYYYRWSQDPFVQGSYSEPYVGFTSEDFNKLGQNLGRLYFAGEATSEEWYGYMQGAYYTGEEKGKMIACQIHPNESECKDLGPTEKTKPKSKTTFAVRSAPGVLLLSLLFSRFWV